MRSAFRRYFGSVLFAVLLAASIGLGAAAGVLFVYASALPQVESLEDYRPNVITEVYGDDGQVIGSFALERRIIVEPGQIPPVLRDAIVSVEDQNFYEHWGLDVYGIARAALRNIRAGRVVEGGSTITQQLSENLFLSPKRQWAIKLQEALFAIQIERHYTKDEILTLYINQIYLGHGMYGFAAAAEFYFGKNIRDLTIEEAATLAALPRAPSTYSPVLSPDRSLMRRNYAIDRMVAEGKIAADLGEQAKQQPSRLNQARQADPLAPYFVEELRRYLEETYGSYAVHEGGLRVHSTLDARLQAAAQESLRRGLREFDKRHGWRGAPLNLVTDGIDDLEGHTLPDWRRPLRAGNLVRGIVLEADERTARVRVAQYSEEIGPAEIAWTGATRPSAILARGDVASFLVQSVDPAAKTIQLALDQEPRVEGALLVIENQTGEVKAMVGGYDYARSQFNRATQALRQTGSIFKPFLYTAALESGMRPEDLIDDSPVDFDGYAPVNYDREFRGPITLRAALAGSRNVPAVRVLSQIGFDRLRALVGRMGITAPIQPYLPIALGATDMTLIEVTSAYSTFPNGGVRVEPRLINRVADYDGNVLEENYPVIHDVLPESLAAGMVDLLREVVRTGTATQAQVLGRPVGGKTGTTNDFTDAWFLGFTPSLTVGVWVGFDEKVSLGNSETGGRAALPIWISFMEQAYKDQPVETFDLGGPPSGRSGAGGPGE
jgi:penicillin-binding protein 1A